MSTYNHVQHVVSVNEFRSIADLNGLIGSNDGDSVYVAGYYESINDAPWVKGGGHFVWDSTKLRTEHNGVTIISPTVQWDNTPDTLEDYHAGTLEIEPSGVGCWVRQYETLNVHMAGAVGDGVVDDTISIQSSIDYLELQQDGGMLLFPRGIYLISSEIIVASPGIILAGESRYKSLIKQNIASSAIITTTAAASFFGVTSLSAMYSATPAAGATAFKIQSSYATLSDFVIRSAYIGVFFSGADSVGGKLSNFEILDYESSALVLQNTNDIFIDGFIMNAGNASRGALGGIRLLDKVEALSCSNGDIIYGVHTITSDAAVLGQGTRPAYNKFVNVFFDSYANTAALDDMIETDFVGCWWSGGRSGAGYAGMNTSNAISIRFTNCLFFNNGASGAVINASSSQISFVNCKAESNSVTAGSGISHGFNIQNNTNGFRLIGCIASNGLYTGTQGYGVFIGSGCDNFTITDGDYRGNSTGAISDNSTASSRKICGNLGYVTQNSGTASVIVGQTVVSVTHGLAATPAASDIMLTPSQNPSAKGVQSWNVTSITSTTFQIQVDAAVTGSDLAFGWSARIKGC